MKYTYFVELITGESFTFKKNKTKPVIFDGVWGIKNNKGVITIIPLDQIKVIQRYKK